MCRECISLRKNDTGEKIVKDQFKARREAREKCMQLLFQMETQQDFSAEGKELFLAQYKGVGETEVEDKNPDTKHFEKLYAAVSEHLPEIDAAIEKASNNWKISRFGKVDLAIIRMAVAELLYLDKVPDSVSINEAVEIAKTFGGEESGRFVNGILGKIAGEK
ncbi:MAG: transcription antitermination factor NusB [Clostridiales bacterium]|nr:transcription antitermination factor NusB [Clostridiales bacterium]